MLADAQQPVATHRALAIRKSDSTICTQFRQQVAPTMHRQYPPRFVSKAELYALLHETEVDRIHPTHQRTHNDSCVTKISNKSYPKQYFRAQYQQRQRYHSTH